MEICSFWILLAEVQCQFRGFFRGDYTSERRCHTTSGSRLAVARIRDRAVNVKIQNKNNTFMTLGRYVNTFQIISMLHLKGLGCLQGRKQSLVQVA